MSVIKPSYTDQYVVFVQSTPDVWAKMPDENKKSNTLYFITETGQTNGSLYLGTKLIADGAGLANFSLSSLADVNLVNAIDNGDIIQYNSTTEQWENVSLADTIGSLITVFKPAKEDGAPGTAGLVPQPTSIADSSKFLRGDGTWASPLGTIGDDISELKTQVATIIGEDADKSMRELANEAVAGLIANAPKEFDTLKEIADWIGNHPDVEVVSGLDNRVKALEIEVPKIGNLASSLALTDKDVAALSEKVDGIDQRLKWQSLIEVDE